MKAARDVEAVDLMIASNTITVAHAEVLLKATPPEQRTNVKPAEREKKNALIEKLEKEMNQGQENTGKPHPTAAPTCSTCWGCQGLPELAP